MLGNGQKVREGVEYIFRTSKIFSCPTPSSAASAPKFLVSSSFWGIFYSRPKNFGASGANFGILPFRRLWRRKFLLPPQILHPLTNFLTISLLAGFYIEHLPYSQIGAQNSFLKKQFLSASPGG